MKTLILQDMSINNLKSREAIAKIQDLVNSIDVSMMISYPEHAEYPYMVPMSRQEVDDEGNIWYLFSSESESYKNFEKNNRVSLAFADPSNYSFLNIDGTVEISTDKSRIEKYWNKFVEVYFEKGKEDPNIRILKVTPTDGHYWDTKTNKFMTLVKVATGALTGSRVDIGREGEIDL